MVAHSFFFMLLDALPHPLAIREFLLASALLPQPARRCRVTSRQDWKPRCLNIHSSQYWFLVSAAPADQLCACCLPPDFAWAGLSAAGSLHGRLDACDVACCRGMRYCRGSRYCCGTRGTRYFALSVLCFSLSWQVQRDRRCPVLRSTCAAPPWPPYFVLGGRASCILASNQCVITKYFFVAIPPPVVPRVRQGSPPPRLCIWHLCASCSR